MPQVYQTNPNGVENELVYELLTGETALMWVQSVLAVELGSLSEVVSAPQLTQAVFEQLQRILASVRREEFSETLSGCFSRVQTNKPL